MSRPIWQRRSWALSLALSLPLWLTLWIGSGTAWAQPLPLPVLELDLRQASRSAEGHIGRHIDRSGAMSLEQAQQASYQRIDSWRSGGYRNETHWYRLSLQRPAQSRSDWVLALGEPYLDDVTVWIVRGDARSEHRLGDRVPYAQRVLKTATPALALDLPADTRIDVFIRVNSVSALNFNATVWQPEAFQAEEGQANFLQGGYFGVLMIIMLINLLFGLWLRDSSMLFFSGYVAALVMLFLGINGYLPMILPQGPHWAVNGILGAGGLIGTGAAGYTWSLLLGLPRSHPRLHRAYGALLLACLVCVPFCAGPAYRLIAPTIYQLFALYTVVTLVMIVVLGQARQSKEQFMYALAIVLNALGAVSQISIAVNWLPFNPMTQYALQGLSLAQALLMSLGLAIRVGQLRTERLRLQQAMSLAEQRSQEQRRFVAMLSHEFRNPLAIIDRSAQMVILNTPQMAAPERRRMQNIRGGVGMLSTLVDSFLTTESIEQNRLRPEPQACDIDLFVQATVAGLDEEMAARVQVHTGLRSPTWSMDPVLMGVALRNLLINALRYSPQDKPVTVRAITDEQALQLTVIDHGPGLSPQELAQIGQPYYRASTSSGTQGTGLGYHFTERIVRAHGGTLTAHSAPAEGLTVSIRLGSAQAGQA